MPILPAEPDVYPPDLWNGASPADAYERSWWCLHSRPRQEKAAARHLRARHIWHYLPLVIDESHTPAGRRIRSLAPLFPGYLFLLGDDRQRVEALKGNHLVRVLPIVDQEGFVRDLEQIYRMLNSGLPVLPDSAHTVGSRVRITSGPLRGLEGRIVRRHPRLAGRFVAIVDFLGLGASVEMADWQVEPTADGPDGRLGSRSGDPVVGGPAAVRRY